MLNRIVSNKLFLALCFVITVFYSLYFNQFGVDFNDTYYNAIAFVVYQNEGVLNPLYFLTTFSGYSVINLFGNKIIYFRILHSFIFLITLLLPLLLIESTKNRIKLLPYVLLVSLIYGPANQNILNYDTFTYLLTFVHIIILIKYIKNPTYWKIGILSLFSALAIGFKFPTIVLPFLTCIILLVFHLINKQYKTAFRHILYYIILFLFFYLSSVFVFFKDLTTYSQLIFDSSDKVGYSISHLIIGYLRSIVSILIFLCILIFLFFQFREYQKDRIFKFKYLIILVIFFALYITIVFNMRLAWRTAILLSSLYIFVLILHFYYAFDSKKFPVKELLITHLVFFVFYFTPAIGSDTGLTKTAIMFLFISVLITRSYFKAKSFIIFFLFLILPFTIYDRFDRLFGETSFVKLTATVNESNYLKHIKTTQPKADLINHIIKLTKGFQSNGHDVVFVSLFSHYFTYELNKAEVKVCKNFRMDVEKPAIVSEITNYLIGKEVKPIIIYIKPYYPEYFNTNIKPQGLPKTHFESALMKKLNYSMMDNPSFQLFLPEHIKPSIN